MVEPHPDSIVTVINGLTENQLTNCMALASTLDIIEVCSQIGSDGDAASATNGGEENQDALSELSFLVGNNTSIHDKLNNALKALVINKSSHTNNSRKSRQNAVRKPVARKK